jgi:hypothetical protein
MNLQQHHGKCGYTPEEVASAVKRLTGHTPTAISAYCICNALSTGMRAREFRRLVAFRLWYDELARELAHDRTIPEVSYALVRQREDVGREDALILHLAALHAQVQPRT